MNIQLSKVQKPLLSISGHAGCGHCHSHKQYIQDDSGGLAVALSLLSEASDTSLLISDLHVEIGSKGYFEVTTISGGKARAYPRRGITPHEAKLAYNIIGQEAVCTQALALFAYGRVYGQGAAETAVSLQTAIANAAIDSFHRNYPDNFVHGHEELEGNCGTYTGAIVDINNIPVAIMAIANASEGGIGPNEDLEGNCIGKGKKKGMEKLGMIDSPTIIIEGKVYTPMYCDELEEENFFVRYDTEADNKYVGSALYESGKALGYNIILNAQVMKRVKDGLKNSTEQVAQRIIDLGNALQIAQSSHKKVQIVAELAKIISEDAGGVTYMSNELNEIISGAGVMPATSAVLSLLVTKEHREKFIMPYMDNRDVQRFKDIIVNAVPAIVNNIDLIQKDIKERGFKDNIDKYIEYNV